MFVEAINFFWYDFYLSNEIVNENKNLNFKSVFFAGRSNEVKNKKKASSFSCIQLA
jgi:hypothetical protein